MVVLSAAGCFRWCALWSRLRALLTVSVPSVDSAYSAESTDGTLTKSAMKTVLFQYSEYTYGISGAGADGAVFHDTPKYHFTYH